VNVFFLPFFFFPKFGTIPKMLNGLFSLVFFSPPFFFFFPGYDERLRTYFPSSFLLLFRDEVLVRRFFPPLVFGPRLGRASLLTPLSRGGCRRSPHPFFTLPVNGKRHVLNDPARAPCFRFCADGGKNSPLSSWHTPKIRPSFFFFPFQSGAWDNSSPLHPPSHTNQTVLYPPCWARRLKVPSYLPFLPFLPLVGHHQRPFF